MLNLTRKTDYALVALARLAEASPTGEAALSARQIAQEYDLPLPLLMNVLKDLQQAQIIGSARGPRGGYYLARRPDQISLASVVRAIEGPVSLALCCEAGSDPECSACQLMARCPIVDAMQRFNGQIRAFLSQLTLDQLLDAEVDVPLDQVNVRPGAGRRPRSGDQSQHVA